MLWGATGEQEWTPALTTGILKKKFNSIFELFSKFCNIFSDVQRFFTTEELILRRTFNIRKVLQRFFFRLKFFQTF